jgi:hypothetical protein
LEAPRGTEPWEQSTRVAIGQRHDLRDSREHRLAIEVPIEPPSVLGDLDRQAMLSRDGLLLPDHEVACAHRARLRARAGVR